MKMNLKWIGVLVCLAAGVQGHPGHDSVTQADYRSESGLLEVTVSVHAGELERALSHQLGRKVVINPSADEWIDQHILQYLQERFLLEKDDGKRLEFVWVGREMGKSNAHHADGDLVLLHFEAALVGGLERLQVRQGIFCEFNDDQINLVHLREDDRKLTLGFSPQHEAKAVAFTQAE
jgi:hypothetical protein